MKAAQSSKYYWTDNTEQSIVLYNKNNNEHLFTHNIYPALLIMSEVYTSKYNANISIRQESINDCISYLHSKLNTYNKDKGRSFNWFSMLANQYYLQNIKKNKQQIQTIPLEDIHNDIDMKQTMNESLNSVYDTKQLLQYIINYSYYQPIHGNNTEKYPKEYKLLSAMLAICGMNDKDKLMTYCKEHNLTYNFVFWQMKRFKRYCKKYPINNEKKEQ